ncbi:MAG TPA: tetratricopeptide repeat protein, partial [Polyangiaceae bacterium]|nr:tetratricopeptide repeat protein [Polyangiaceae bacterium]
MAIDREKTLVAAQKYVEKKKYDKAVIEYQKVIQEDPNDARTLLKVGDLQSKMEEYAGAVATYERVGKFYASQGFLLKAIAVYKQIREIIEKHVPQLEDKYAHVTPKLAELYHQLGLTSDALGALDDVATRLQRGGREPEAIDVFRKIVELDPVNPLPHLRLAEALSRAKDADGAVAEFAVAAGELAKLGRRDDALKVIERLLQHKPDPTQARAAAELYLARNAPNDGLQALSKLQISFQANPRDLDTLALLARAFNHIGQAAKAIEVQKEMARIARDTGKVDLFREIIDRLLKLVPNDEAVRQLATSSPVTSSAPPPQVSGHAVAMAPAASRRDVPEDEASYEDVSEGEIDDDSGDPIELSRRHEHPPSDTDVLVVESDLPQTSAPSAPVQERMAQILADAATFRRARLPTKAIATLRAGVVALPRAIELREVLRDMLIDVGHSREAVAEMVEIAGLQIEELDAEEAVRTLQDALAIEPHHARAAEMLRALGYELVEEPVPSATAEGLAPTHETKDRDLYDDLPPPAEHPRSDESAPLPSYNLDEIDDPDEPEAGRYPRYEPNASAAQPGRVTTIRYGAPPKLDRAPLGVDRAPQRRHELANEIDDPFGEAPLPSFPLEASTEAGAGVRAIPRSGAELESALEEADFFATRGLYDDARAILDEQLVRLPNHPLLIERLVELDAQEAGAQGGSGTRPSPAAGSIEDRAFDIAESLGALDGPDRSGVPPPPGEPTEQVDVEEVFAKFKEGVAKQIGADDSQSHYDLGLAYKDMGLLDDATREFHTAARDPRRACVCHSMIGMIHLERGHINEAIDALLQGLQVPDRTRDQDAALSYEVGAAYEVKKMNKQALE